MANVRKLAMRKLEESEANEFFKSILLPEKSSSDSQGKQGEVTRHLSAKALREKEALVGLYHSAPGQDLSDTKDTLWGAVNAVTFYVDHVRKAASPGDRLDNAWFGSGNALKDKAWRIAMNRIAAPN